MTISDEAASHLADDADPPEPRTPEESLGDRVRNARERRQLSRQQLADKLAWQQRHRPRNEQVRVCASTIAKVEQSLFDWVRRFDQGDGLSDKHRALLAETAGALDIDLGELLGDAAVDGVPEPLVALPTPADSWVPEPTLTPSPTTGCRSARVASRRGRGVPVIGAALLAAAVGLVALVGQPALRSAFDDQTTAVRPPISRAPAPRAPHASIPPAPSVPAPPPSVAPPPVSPPVAVVPPAVTSQPEVAAPSRPASAVPRVVHAARVVAGPVAQLRTTLVDFGSVPVGSSTARTVTLRNTGTADLHIKLVMVVQGVDLDVTDHGCLLSTLAPGQSCSLTVTFHPGQRETENSSIVFTDDDARGGSQQVGLRGSAA